MTKKEQLLIMIDFCIDNKLDLYIEYCDTKTSEIFESKISNSDLKVWKVDCAQAFDDRLILKDRSLKIINFCWI